MTAKYKIGQIFQQQGLPCVITGHITDYDPYLMYCNRIQYKNVITGEVTSFADIDYINPYMDINGAIEGKVYSRYV